MKLEISKLFTFEASHILPKHPGKCKRLHGHSFRLTVAVSGEVNPETGFVMDYADLKKYVQPLVDSLDHKHLGAWDGIKTTTRVMDGYDEETATDWRVIGLPLTFYPSSENLIVWIGDQLAKSIGHDKDGNFLGYFANTLPWSRLELEETCTSKAILLREDYEKAKIVR